MLISSVSSVQTGASALGALGRLSPVQEVRKVAPRGPGMELPEDQSRAAVVQISDEGRRAALAAAVTGADGHLDSNSAEETKASDPTELDEEAKAEVEELAKRDREVRTHEQAHKSAGGQYAGAIHLDMVRGPDGQNYAVGGHVNIDVSPVADDPRATIAKMQQVMRAALAPAEPSSADRAVAAKAGSQASEARQQLSAETTQALESSAQADPNAQAGGAATADVPGPNSGMGAQSGSSPIGPRNISAQPSDQVLADSVARALSKVA